MSSVVVYVLMLWYPGPWGQRHLSLSHLLCPLTANSNSVCSISHEALWSLVYMPYSFISLQKRLLLPHIGHLKSCPALWASFWRHVLRNHEVLQQGAHSAAELGMFPIFSWQIMQIDSDTINSDGTFCLGWCLTQKDENPPKNTLSIWHSTPQGKW